MGVILFLCSAYLFVRSTSGEVAQTTEGYVEEDAYLLTVAWLAILTLCAMNEGRGFCVKTMQTIGLLVDKGIVLRNKLPSNFRRNNRRGGGIRHAMNGVLAQFRWFL
jgi:hypothetical protein